MAPYLSLSDQRRLRITVPEPDEQRAIARVLGALDDKIELNRRMNRTLEELAGALFRAWFVDFEPVVAKAAGRAPFGLAPAVAALFPAAFVDSELGPIPLGWRVRRLAEIADVDRRTMLRRNYPHDGRIRGHLGGERRSPRRNHPISANLHPSGRSVTWRMANTICSCVRPNQVGPVHLRPAPNLVVSPMGYTAISPRCPSAAIQASSRRQRPKSSRITSWQWVREGERVGRANGPTFGKAPTRPVPQVAVAGSVRENSRAVAGAVRPQRPRIPHPRRAARHAAAEATFWRNPREYAGETGSIGRMSMPMNSSRSRSTTMVIAIIIAIS